MLVRTLGRLVVAAVRQTPSPALVARIAVRPNLVSLRTLSTTLVSRDGYYEPLPPPPDIRPSRQLFVANIAFNATEADIRDAAALFGDIESVRLIVHPDGFSRGFAYVTFTEQDAANRCLQNGLFFYGRPARVNYQDQNTARSNRDASTRSNPPSCALFLGTLPLGIVESDLRAHFASFGPLASVRIGTHPTGEPRGFAHVQFEREEDAIACFEKYAAEPLWILDQSVRVDYAAARKTSRTPNPPTQKLYFYKFTGDEAALRKTLGELEASVQKVHFLTNRITNHPTGSGFVEFVSVERATQALHEVSGINLEYAVVKPRPVSDLQKIYGSGMGRMY